MQIGWARVNVTESLIQAEVLARLLLDRVLNSLDTLGKPGEDLLHISTLLHGNDTELILLVDPDKEGLVPVVEDATSLRPVTLHAGNSQVPVSRHKQEMVVNKLLANPLVHSSQGVVLSSKVGRETLDGIDHQLLNSNTLLLGDTGRQTKSINRATNADPARVNRDIRRDVSLDLANIHIRGVPGRGADSVVLLDQGVEHRGKVLVGVPVTSAH